MSSKLDKVGSYFPKLWDKQAEDFRVSYDRLSHEARGIGEQAFDTTFDASLQFYSHLDAWSQAFMSIFYWVAISSGVIWGAISVYSSGIVNQNEIFSFVVIGLWGVPIWLVTIGIGAGIGVIVCAVTVRKILFLTLRRLSYLRFVKKIGGISTKTRSLNFQKLMRNVRKP